MNAVQHNPWLHRVALATAAATFPLIFMGGLVTSHGAGMSVPDWPNSYGYNMFTFPPSQWVGGIFYEHTHRLMGALVGLGATLLFIMAWGWGRDMIRRRRLTVAGAAFAILFIASGFVPWLRKIHLFELFGFLAFVFVGSIFCRTPQPRWIQWLATATLLGVIFQGILGGLRVVMVELDLAIVHACFAQAFFCLAALMCVVTSKWWIAARDSGFQPVLNGRTLPMLGAACVILIFAQLLVGAMMRHYNAGLAIPDVPLNYGHVLPPTDGAELKAANDYRKWELDMPEVTMTQVWLHFGHRVGAVAVSGLLIALIVKALRSSSRISAIRNPAIAIAGLLIVQITLGVMTVLMKKPADIASAHVACGALLLMTTFVLTVRAARLACDTGFQPVRKTGEQKVSGMADRAHGLEARVTMSAS